MNHIDEHTLELFLLGDEGVLERSSAIEAHLAECAGYRALADEIRSLYGDAIQHFSAKGDTSPENRMALVRQRQNITFFGKARTYPNSVPFRPERRHPLQRVYETARRNPVRSAAACFAALGIVFALFNFTAKHFFPKKNPAYTLYNISHNTIEVFDANDEKLWDLGTKAPLTEIRNLENDSQVLRVQVTDLNGDGMNEVIMGLQVGEVSAMPYPLSIYSADKKLIKKIQYPERIFNYTSNHYEEAFSFSIFAVGDFGGRQKNEILAVMLNGRSPCILARFDADGNLLGEYYHYGTMTQLYLADVNRDGIKEIILCGMNDRFESTNDRPPVIVVLDPEKIVGKSQSLLTPGFGLTPSTAEMYYIQLPQTDINRALACGSYVRCLAVSDTSKQLRFTLNGYRPRKYDFEFEYIFSHSMNLLDVKADDSARRFHDDLFAQGKVSGSIDDAYLKALKSGVVYHIRDGRRIQFAADNVLTFPQ